MATPQIGCSTFGSWDFIRVPAPAARTTTAAGRLTVTWRCSLIDCCVAGRRPRPGLGYNRSRGDETVHIPDCRRIPSSEMLGGRHARSITRITLLSVTIAAARGDAAGSVSKYPYQETRLYMIHHSGYVPRLLSSAGVVPMFTGFR